MSSFDNRCAKHGIVLFWRKGQLVCSKCEDEKIPVLKEMQEKEKQ